MRNYVPLIPINYMLIEAHDKLHDLIWIFYMKRPER